MNIELQKLELKTIFSQRCAATWNQQQREYFLHQQMKTIQEELGGSFPMRKRLINTMRRKGEDQENVDVESCKEHFDKELAKMQRMNPQVAEYSIQRNYLDLFLGVAME